MVLYSAADTVETGWQRSSARRLRACAHAVTTVQPSDLQNEHPQVGACAHAGAAMNCPIHHRHKLSTNTVHGCMLPDSQPSATAHKCCNRRCAGACHRTTGAHAYPGPSTETGAQQHFQPQLAMSQCAVPCVVAPHRDKVGCAPAAGPRPVWHVLRPAARTLSTAGLRLRSTIPMLS